MCHVICVTMQLLWTDVLTIFQELRVPRPSARLSRGATVDEPDANSSPRPPQEPPGPQEPTPSDSLLHPLVIQFSILLQVFL